MVGVTESVSRSRNEERLRANAEKAATYYSSYRKLAEGGDDERAKVFLKDPAKVAYIESHSSFSELMRDLWKIDHEMKQVQVAKGLSDEQRRQALHGLKESRESLLRAADAIDHQLSDVRLGIHK